MSEKFDPYHEWLGIPETEQPPNHYRLLGITALEKSPSVIENAANQRMSHLRTFQAGKHSAESQRLLNEVSAARVCLLNPAKKAAYDKDLESKLTPKKSLVVATADDSGLADIFDSPLPAGASSISKVRGKKPPPLTQPRSNRTRIIAAAAIATVIALAGVTVLTLRGGRSSEEAAATGSANPADSASAPRDTNNAALASANPKTSAKASATPTAPKQIATAAPKPTGTQPPAAVTNGPNHVALAGIYSVPHATANAVTGGNSVAGAASATPADSSLAEPPGEVEKEEKKETKLAPPSADEQKKLIAEIDEIYKSNATMDTAAKAALARKLLDYGRKDAGNKAEQFVLFRRAGELARDAGESSLAMEAVDAIVAAGFDIPTFHVKARLLKRLLEQGALTGPQLASVSATCMKFAQDAAAQDAAGDALEVLEAARPAFAELGKREELTRIAARAAATHARNPQERAERASKADEAQREAEAARAALAAATEFAQSLEQTVHEQQALHAAQEKLDASPDDPDASLEVGRWRCLQEGDWDKGLKLLAKGSDAAVKALAAADLAAKPSKVDDRIARGDAWWDAAENAKGDIQSLLRHRAYFWYSKALPDVSGLEKVKVAKRVDALAADASNEPAAKPGWAPTKTARLGNSTGGTNFEEGTATNWLVGFDASVKHILGRDAISSIQGLYLSAGKQTPGQLRGRVNGNPTTIVARPGYAVGGIIAHGGDRFDGFRVVFMRIKGRTLDPTETYQTDWLGGSRESTPVHLGGNGNPVIGIYGKAGDWIDSLGLIQLGPPEPDAPAPTSPVPAVTSPVVSAPAPAGGAAVIIVSAEWGGGKKWANVTARVRELANSGNDFSAKPETLRSDPTPGWRKKLKVVYRKDNLQRTMWTDENGRVNVQAMKP